MLDYPGEVPGSESQAKGKGSKKKKKGPQYPTLTVPKSPKFAPTRLKAAAVVKSTEQRALDETK